MESTWYFAQIAQVEELVFSQIDYEIRSECGTPMRGDIYYLPLGSRFESYTMESTWYFAQVVQVEEAGTYLISLSTDVIFQKSLKLSNIRRQLKRFGAFLPSHRNKKWTRRCVHQIRNLYAIYRTIYQK
jgi:hypothetical protein